MIVIMHAHGHTFNTNINFRRVTRATTYILFAAKSIYPYYFQCMQSITVCNINCVRI